MKGEKIMHINTFDGDPYAEVQHILEVLERRNPVKGITEDTAIIQIEQSNLKDVEIVLEELKERGYTIVSKRRYQNFTVAGIKKCREKTKKDEIKTIARKTGGDEIGD